jgi:hypothetical protein
MNAISPGIYAAVVLVAVLTTLVAPFMLNAAFRGIKQRQPEPVEEFSIG